MILGRSMLNPSSNAYYNTVGTGGLQNASNGNNTLIRKNNNTPNNKVIDVFKFSGKDTGGASGRVTVGKWGIIFSFLIKGGIINMFI